MRSAVDHMSSFSIDKNHIFRNILSSVWGEINVNNFLSFLVMFLFTRLLFFISFTVILLKEEWETMLQKVERILSQKTPIHQITELIKVGACLHYLLCVFSVNFSKSYIINFYFYVDSHSHIVIQPFRLSHHINLICIT